MVKTKPLLCDEELRYFSMFTGIGGFELGIERALDNKYVAEEQQNRKGRNGDIDESGLLLRSSKNSALCVGFSEIDKYASELLQNKWSEVQNYGDATQINAEELPDFDMLVGGFPCQAFSIAGKRRGFEDTRGTLFFDIARIIKAKQPRIFVLENVKGLLNHNKGETFTTILKTIDELGYDAEWQVLNSKHHGVPQNRERVFIVGHIRGSSGSKVFPLGQSSERDIVSQGEAQGEGERVRSEVASTLAKRDYKGGNNLIQNTITQATGNRAGSSKEYLAHCKKVNQACGEIRRLTPVECERLQGFPDGWTGGFSDTQRYKMLGNAVTVNVVASIMKKVI